MDEAMTIWQAEMASNLKATMEPMRGLFFALSTGISACGCGDSHGKRGVPDDITELTGG
jgi:hypothetical protein